MKNGFTLIELLIVICLFCVLLMATTPSAKNTSINRLVHHQQKIQMLLIFARQQAIADASYITVCPLENNLCTNNWNQPISVFKDPQKLEKLTSDSIIYRVLEPELTTSITLEATSNRYVQFSPIGLSHGTIGTVVLCSKNEIIDFGSGVIINFAGRSRIDQLPIQRCTGS